MSTPFINWPSCVESRIGFGADYNPEQWPRETWADDVALMKEAGVNLVSVGIFSWGLLEPSDGTFDFAWLREVLDLLHAHGIAVDLATGTASPPQWLVVKHPEILPINAAGQVYDNTSRQHWRPTSTVFKEYALRLTTAMATEFKDHPAVVMWHINNELGCHNTYDFSEDAIKSFRTWLQNKYNDLKTLNVAWGTSFWSQRYTDWDQIQLPQNPMTFGNPTQTIDFKRFSSDALRDYLDAEAGVLRTITPEIPITTNFMVMWTYDGADYASWADHVDVVSNDHYLRPGVDSWIEQSFSASHTRGIAKGRNWMLMEHSTSQVSWQPVNYAKPTGQLELDSGTHLAHGADAICFFQWRQSTAGAEKFHSALVPHSGKESRIWPEVVGLGRKLEELSFLAGAPVEKANIALLFDQDSLWALANNSVPTQSLKYREHALAWYQAFIETGHPVDVIPANSSLESYDIVIAPSLYMVSDEMAERLRMFTANNGLLIGTFFTGIADEHDHIAADMYPARLGDLFGARITDWAPLTPETEIPLTNGWSGSLWSERLIVGTGKVLAHYADGKPAIVETENTVYVSTLLKPASLRELAQEITAQRGLKPLLKFEAGHRAEMRIRVTEDGNRFAVILNHDSGSVEFSGQTVEAKGLHVCEI